MSSTSITRERGLAGWWAWLFPLTYLIHIAEEYWAGEGFPAWLSRVADVELTPARFLELNSFAWVLMVVSIILVLSVRSLSWLLVSFGTVVLINGLAHLLGSIFTVSYSPGLISGLLLWLPLGAITLHRSRKLASRRAMSIGVSVGLVLHAIISLLAFNGGR